MSILLFLTGLLARAVLLAVIFAGSATALWVLWDCYRGPSAQLAAERRRARGEVAS